MLRKRLSKTGLGVLDVVVAIAVLSSVIYTGNKFLSHSYKQLDMVGNQESRDELYKKIASVAANIDAIRTSIDANIRGHAGNRLLRNCVDPTRTCLVTDPQNMAPFWLENRTGGMGNGGVELVAGPGSGSPTSLYNDDLDSIGCSSPGPDCPFQVRSWFFAACPVPPARHRPPSTCNEPESIYVVVRVARSYIAPKERERVRPVPASWPEIRRDPHAYAFVHSTKDIVLRSQQNCPSSTEHRIVGHDASGTPLCECIAGCRLLDSNRPARGCAKDVNGHELCNRRRLTCRNNEFMAGIKADGSPLCRPIPPDRCISEKTITLQVQGDCGIGFQMTRVDYGECRAITNGKGGGVDDIDCDDDTATCCQLDL